MTHCSFCGCTNRECKVLVTSSIAAICDRCSLLAAEQVKAALQSKAKPRVKPRAKAKAQTRKGRK